MRATLTVLLGAGCAFLLTSLGGAGAFAAPVTIPLLWLAIRAATSPWRWLLVLIAALTAFEAGSVLAYVALGGDGSSHRTELISVVVAVILAVATAVICGHAARHSSRSRSTQKVGE